MLSAASPSPGAPHPLFGRSEVYEETLRRLHETRDANLPQLLLVTGEGGVGKSVLLHAVTKAAIGLGFEVLVGRTLPTDVPAPFGLVGELLRSAQSEHRVRETVALGGTPALPLFAAPFDPEPSAAIARATGLADEDPGMKEADRLLAHLANPAERMDADRSTFFGRLTDFFVDLAREHPLFLALDDLQFADDSSLEFIRRFVAGLKEARIFILAAALPTAESPDRSVAALERLAQGPNSSSVRLRPMTEAELAEYVRWLLDGRDPGRAAVMRWFSQTEGNPLFAEYLVRSTTGFGNPSAESESPDLWELLRSRVRRMSEAERRVLVHASVLGKEFDFGTLDIACGQEEERLSEHLDRLVHEGLLREKAGEVYEFVSERVRVDVYSQLTETRRRLLHRKVARALLERDGVTASNLYELARQFYLGRDDVRGVDLNRRAAEAAARAFAFDTAAVHLERALEG
ncbi:MAG TPA: AAA family ATPase, partial [Thermoplasmata archaeon]